MIGRQFAFDFAKDIAPDGSFDYLTAANGASVNIDLVECWFSGAVIDVMPLREYFLVGVVINNVVVKAVHFLRLFICFSMELLVWQALN